MILRLSSGSNPGGRLQFCDDWYSRIIPTKSPWFKMREDIIQELSVKECCLGRDTARGSCPSSCDSDKCTCSFCQQRRALGLNRILNQGVKFWIFMELHCIMYLLVCPPETFTIFKSSSLQLSAFQGPLTFRPANISCIRKIVCSSRPWNVRRMTNLILKKLRPWTVMKNRVQLFTFR
jgi:hypothetical protein